MITIIILAMHNFITLIPRPKPIEETIPRPKPILS